MCVSSAVLKKRKNLHEDCMFRKMSKQTNICRIWQRVKTKMHLFHSSKNLWELCTNFQNTRPYFFNVIWELPVPVFRRSDLAGSHTEAMSPVAISPSNKAIYHIWTKQIHLYRTPHTGAVRYHMLLYHGNISLSNMTCGLLGDILPLINVIFAVADPLHAIWCNFYGGGYRGYSKLIEISKKMYWEDFQNRKILKIFGYFNDEVSDF